VCVMLPPAAAGEPAPSPALATHATGQAPAAVAAYWTPARMAAAEPIEAPEGSGTTGAEAIASAQAPDLEVDPARDTAYPERLHGKLFVTIGADNATCSATVVTSRSRNLLLTAGHCVVQPGGEGVQPVWATNVMFVPAYRNGAMPFGAWFATRLRAPLRWAVEPDIALDIGAVNLAPGPTGKIENALGARGVSFNRSARSYRGKRFRIFGYPGEPAAFYDAERPIICNPRFKGFEKFSGSLLIAPCNMKQGASGGGWMLKKGLLNSVVSHGTCPVATAPTCTSIAGTFFGPAAFKLWSKAGGGLTKGKRRKLRRCRKLRKAGARARCRTRAQTFRPTVR
jgi:hypothetical protein